MTISNLNFMKVICFVMYNVGGYLPCSVEKLKREMTVFSQLHLNFSCVRNEHGKVELMMNIQVEWLHVFICLRSSQSFQFQIKLVCLLYVEVLV